MTSEGDKMSIRRSEDIIVLLGATIGVVGALLIQPGIVSVGAALAVIATAKRLRDRSKPPSLSGS
jgi:hypothetical protein